MEIYFLFRQSICAWFPLYKPFIFNRLSQTFPIRMLGNKCNSTLLIQAKSTVDFYVIENTLWKIHVNFFWMQVWNWFDLTWSETPIITKTPGSLNLFQGNKLTAQTPFITKQTPFMIIKQKPFIKIHKKKLRANLQHLESASNWLLKTLIAFSNWGETLFYDENWTAKNCFKYSQHIVARVTCFFGMMHKKLQWSKCVTNAMQ